MTGNQSVTVEPNEWKSGRHPSIDECAGRSSREPNCETLARTLRWLSATPFGSPEEPDVKSRTASSLPRRVLSLRNLLISDAGRIFEMTAQRMIFFLRLGIARSMKIRSRLGGHGKLGTRRTKGSAVMKRSTPDWRIAERTASGPAVKLKFTGIFPAKMTARLAMRPALPGGSTIATRS